MTYLVVYFVFKLTLAGGEKRNEVFIHSLELGHTAGTRAIKAMGELGKSPVAPVTDNCPSYTSLNTHLSPRAWFPMTSFSYVNSQACVSLFMTGLP